MKIHKDPQKSISEDGSTTFLTSATEFEPAACSKREAALQERVNGLETEVRTMEKMLEVHTKAYQTVDRQRAELTDIDSTARKLASHLDALQGNIH